MYRYQGRDGEEDRKPDGKTGAEGGGLNGQGKVERKKSQKTIPTTPDGSPQIMGKAQKEEVGEKIVECETERRPLYVNCESHSCTWTVFL